MSTFAEYLPTMTAREREIVEAYDTALVGAQKNMKAGRPYADPRTIMRSTPQAPEPQAFDGVVGKDSQGDPCIWVDADFFQPGTLVRVTKS